MLSPSAAVRHGALVLAHRQRDTLVVTGPDRQSWLNSIVTCDVAGLRPGTGVCGLLLTKQGRIQTDLVVAASPETLYVGVAGGRGAELLAFLDRMLVMEDAELRLGHDLAWIEVHGPAALDVAAAVVAPVCRASSDRLGTGGAVLVVHADQVGPSTAVLLTQPGAVLADGPAWDRVRLAHGLPEFGVDYGPEDNPHQAGLERRAVSWSKGCYLGQEVVCMADMRGKVRRRLASIVLEAPPPPRGTPIVAAERGEVLGEVTSAIASEDGSHSLILGRVLRVAVEAREALRIAGGQARFVEVSPEPTR